MGNFFYTSTTIEEHGITNRFFSLWKGTAFKQLMMASLLLLVIASLHLPLATTDVEGAAPCSKTITIINPSMLAWQYSKMNK